MTALQRYRLQQYRRNIIKDLGRMEIFIIELIEDIGDPDLAQKWFLERFVPSFEVGIADFRKNQKGVTT